MKIHIIKEKEHLETDILELTGFSVRMIEIPEDLPINEQSNRFNKLIKELGEEDE
jgi:hypothetical protein